MSATSSDIHPVCYKPRSNYCTVLTYIFIQFTCRFRESTRMDPEFTCAGHSLQVTCVAFSSNGMFILSGGKQAGSLCEWYPHFFLVGLDGMVILWSAVNGECLFKFADPFGGPISCLVWIETPGEESDHPSICYGNASGHLVLCGYADLTVSSLSCLCAISIHLKIGNL